MKILLYNLVALNFVFLFSIQIYAQDTTQTAVEPTAHSDTAKSQSNVDLKIRSTSAEEMREIILEDAADLLTLLPGVSAIDFGSLGQFSTFSFRGASPQSASIFWDDMPLVEPIHGTVHVSNIPINPVDRVYSLTAAENRAGALRFSPQPFSRKSPYSKVVFRAGDWEYTDIGVLLALPVNDRTQLLFSADRTETNGFFSAPRESDLAPPTLPRHKGAHAFGKLSHAFNSKVSLEYSLLLNDNDVDVPGPALPDLVPHFSNARREENRLDQLLKVRLGERFEGRVLFSKIDQKTFDDSLLFDNSDFTTGIDLEQQRSLGSHSLILGAGTRADFLKSANLGNRNDWLAHGFVRDDFSFAESWRARLQLRVEKHQDFSLAVLPSATVNHHLSKKSTLSLNAQVTRRYPTFAERFWPTQFFRGNLDLNNENTAAVEIGMSTQVNSGLKVEAAIFTHRSTGWIGNAVVDTGAQIFGPLNAGARTVSGAESKLNWNYSRFGCAGLAGSYWKAWDDDPIKALFVPEYKLYGYLENGRHFFQKFVLVKARLIGRIFGPHVGWEYENNSPLPTLRNLGTNAVVDGQISFKFTSARLLISMENVFDRYYELVPRFSMPPKTFRFTIEWEFLD